MNNSTHWRAIATHLSAAQVAEEAYTSEMKVADVGGKRAQLAAIARGSSWERAIYEARRLRESADEIAGKNTEDHVLARAALDAAAGTPPSYLLGRVSTAPGARAAAESIAAAGDTRSAFWFLAGIAENKRLDEATAGEVRAVARRAAAAEADNYRAGIVAARHAYARLLGLGALVGMASQGDALAAEEESHYVPNGDGSRRLPQAEYEHLLHDIAGVPRANKSTP